MHLARCECASMHNSSLFCSNTRSIDTLTAWLTFHRHFPRLPKTFIVGFFPYINKVTSLSALVRASGEKCFSLKPSGYPEAINQFCSACYVSIIDCRLGRLKTGSKIEGSRSHNLATGRLMFTSSFNGLNRRCSLGNTSKMFKI